MVAAIIDPGGDPAETKSVEAEIGWQGMRAIFSRGSASDRPGGQVLELEVERIPEPHVALRHQHAGGVGLRADPPMGAGKAAPLEFADRIRRIKRRRREGDGSA